jgi:hypothetical protein
METLFTLIIGFVGGVLGALLVDFVRAPIRQFFTLRTEIRHEMLRLANVPAPDPLGGITAPGILGSTVTRRVRKRKNLSSARHYDQIRFRFHTAKIQSGHTRRTARMCWTNYGVQVAKHKPRFEASEPV